MSILIKSGEKYYEIPDDVLEKFKISKEDFEKDREEESSDVEGQCLITVVGPNYHQVCR